MKQMTGQKNYGLVMIKIQNKIKNLIGNNPVSVIAPGKTWKNFVNSLNNVIEVYDFDPLLDSNYIKKDVIFDDVVFKTNLLLTLHAEILYPLNKIFTKHNHIMVLNTKYFYTYCTNEHILDKENFNKLEDKNYKLYF